jgi:hypothetical protein
MLVTLSLFRDVWPMRIPTHFSTSLAALTLVLVGAAAPARSQTAAGQSQRTPAQSQNALNVQTSSPAPTTATDPSAATRAADSVATRRAIDSATRRAVDSATRRVLDSAFTDLRDDRSERQVVLVVLGVLGGIFLWLFVEDMWRGHDVLMESHWGGFGGGVAGTRLSRTLVLAVLLLFTWGMLTAVALSRPGLPKPDEKKEPTRDASRGSGS